MRSSGRRSGQVPGAGALDVDPNEEPWAATAFAGVALLALAVSVAKTGDATGVFGASPCDEVASSEVWYVQCVADLFG